jgi:hypothetical protein
VFPGIEIALDESERTLAESCLVRRFRKIGVLSASCTVAAPWWSRRLSIRRFRLQNFLKRYGRVLLTPGSVLTLTIVYHAGQNNLEEKCAFRHLAPLPDQNPLSNLALAARAEL